MCLESVAFLYAPAENTGPPVKAPHRRDADPRSQLTTVEIRLLLTSMEKETTHATVPNVDTSLPPPCRRCRPGCCPDRRRHSAPRAGRWSYPDPPLHAAPHGR